MLCDQLSHNIWWHPFCGLIRNRFFRSGRLKFCHCVWKSCKPQHIKTRRLRCQLRLRYQRRGYLSTNKYHDHSDHSAHGQTRCAESSSQGIATSPARHKGERIRICARTGLHRLVRVFQNDPPHTGISSAVRTLKKYINIGMRSYYE